MSTAVSADTQTRQLVAFTLGEEEYGVPINWVQEIIRYAHPRPIPQSAPHVEGVINLRGRIIPVVDLRARFGVRGERPDDAKIVVVELHQSTVGVIVDEVREVLTISAEAAEAPPAGVTSAAADYIEAVAKLDGRLLVILDVERLFGDTVGGDW